MMQLKPTGRLLGLRECHEEACRENEMKNFLKIVLTGQAAIFYLASLAAVVMVAIPATGFAAGEDGPPPFTFKDRCVPHQLTDAAMYANGIDPTRILGGAGPGGGGGPPGPPEPGGGNIQDLDEFDNPVPCDDFHTSWRRGTYEACHFYDGSPCYFTVNGQLDQDAFTDDAAGRRAFEIAEHFVIYEMVQNGPPEVDQQFFDSELTGMDPETYRNVDPFFTNPFFGGFAVGTQTKIINSGPSYFQDNPSGIWKIGFVRYTQKAFDALAFPLAFPEEYAFLNNMRITNGVNSQGGLTGMPLIVKGPEIFELSEMGLASVRYRLGADGVPGGSEGPRYLLCPVHENPAANGVIIPGEDIIREWETVLEYQVPCTDHFAQNIGDPGDPDERGHSISCSAYTFGPTPPPAEQCLYDHFACLQRTGDWCGGTFKSGPNQCPPPPFAYD
jgi:hypothetical protein